MPDELIQQLITRGDVLATVDGMRYVAVHLVYECPQDGAPSFYCRCGEWGATPAARLAERDRQLAELADLLARTQQQAVEAERHVQRLSEEKAELEKLVADLPSAPAEKPKHYRSQDKRIECPGCGASIWPKQLDKHRQFRCSGQRQAPEPPPIVAEPIEQVADNRAWSCAECKSSAFARSLADPTRCLRCAKVKNAVISVPNGQLAA